ncbi:MAG: hypothetical protein AAF358_13695 [Pseudomonadota bacterium]
MAIELPYIYSGYQFSRLITLQSVNASNQAIAYPLDPGTDVVTVAVVSEDGDCEYTDFVASESTDTGADWLNGVVAVNVPGSETAKLADRHGEQVQVWIRVSKDGELQPFHIIAEVRKGPGGASAT